jgi:flagellin
VSASAIVITEGTTVGGKAIFGTASTVNVADDKYGTIKINNVEIDLDAKGVTTLSSLAASINEAFGDSKNPVTATVSGNKIALKANVDIVLADDQHKTGAITNIFDGAETIAATKSYKVIASASKSYDIDFSKLEKMVVKSVELSGFTYDTSKKFTINGIEIVGQGANLDATITNINAKASTTGVTAFKDGTKLVLISKSAIIVGAVTGVDGSSVLGGAGTVSENSYGRFSLNGKTIELTTNTKAALVAAINSSNSGVMASLSGDSVTLATMNADMILADDTFSTGLVQSLFGGAKTVASKELTLPPSVLSEGDFKVEAAGYGRFKINDTTIDVKNSDLKALALSINKTMESVVESKRVTVSASDDGKTLYFSSGESFTLADDSLKTGAVEALFGKKFDTAILHKEFFSVNKINVEIGNDLQSTVKSINDTMSKENIDLKAEVIATEKKVFASGFDYSTLSTGSKIKINNIEVTIGSDAKATVASINASMAAAALADTKGKLGVLPEAVEKDGALFLKFKTDISIEGVDGNSAISHVMQSKQESNKSDVVFSKLDGRSKISINGKEITLDGKTAAVNPSSSGRVATGNYDLDLSTLEKKAVKTIDLSTTVFSASDKFKINNIEITAGTNLIVTAKNINDSDANVTAYASGNNLILVSNKADTDMIFADSTSDSAVKYLGGAATVSANSYGSFEINGVVVELTDKTTDSVVIAINTAMKAANKPVVATINDSKLSIVSTGGDLTFASVKHSSTTLNSVFGTAETVTAVSEGAALDAVITAINGAFPAGEVVAEKVDGKLVLKTANDDILVFGDIVDSNVKVASLFDLTETDKAPTKVQFISESGASLSVGNGSYGTNGVSDIFGKVIDVAAEKTGLSINGLNIKVAETVTETVGNIRTALEAAGVDLQVSVKGSNLMFQSSTLTQINFGMDSDISADIKGKNIFGADKTNYASLELNSVNNKPISIELSSSSNAKQHGFLEMNIGASDFDSNDPTFGAASGKSLSGISISTLEGSNSAIDSIDAALSHVSKVRTDLGAVQNRLNYTVNNLSSIITNTAEAKSQIVDTNFAIETSAMTKSQILSQASTAMLAQANKMKQGVLSLLR